MASDNGLEWTEIDEDTWEAASHWQAEESIPLKYRLVRRNVMKAGRIKPMWFAEHDAELGPQKGGPWVKFTAAAVAVGMHAKPFEDEARREIARMQKGGAA